MLKPFHWTTLFLAIDSMFTLSTPAMLGMYWAHQINKTLKESSLSTQTKIMQRRMNQLLIMQVCAVLLLPILTVFASFFRQPVLPSFYIHRRWRPIWWCIWGLQVIMLLSTAVVYYGCCIRCLALWSQLDSWRNIALSSSKRLDWESFLQATECGVRQYNLVFQLSLEARCIVRVNKNSDVNKSTLLVLNVACVVELEHEGFSTLMEVTNIECCSLALMLEMWFH